MANNCGDRRSYSGWAHITINVAPPGYYPGGQPSFTIHGPPVQLPAASQGGWPSPPYPPVPAPQSNYAPSSIPAPQYWPAQAGYGGPYGGSYAPPLQPPSVQPPPVHHAQDISTNRYVSAPPVQPLPVNGAHSLPVNQPMSAPPVRATPPSSQHVDTSSHYSNERIESDIQLASGGRTRERPSHGFRRSRRRARVRNHEASNNRLVEVTEENRNWETEATVEELRYEGNEGTVAAVVEDEAVVEDAVFEPAPLRNRNHLLDAMRWSEGAPGVQYPCVWDD